MAGLTKGRAVWAARALALIICGICGASPRALAQGATDYPIPSSARESFSPIAEGFDSPLEPREDLKGPKSHIDEREERLKAQRQERWPSAPAFFRDTALAAHSRTYWLSEDQFGYTEPKALTTGGSLLYESGYLADFFQLRSVLYTSQPLYANADAGETYNLTPDGDQITTLGQINGRIKFAGQEITAGRQLVRTPYVNPYDIRMIPLTFEGVVLLPENKGQKLNYTASYLTRYKPWDAAGFTPMSAGLGVEQDRGMLITGASYRTKSWNLGAANYWVNDVLNTAYGEIDYLLPFGGGDDDPSFRLGVNYLDQKTVGADLIAGAPIQHLSSFGANRRELSGVCVHRRGVGDRRPGRHSEAFWLQYVLYGYDHHELRASRCARLHARARLRFRAFGFRRCEISRRLGQGQRHAGSCHQWRLCRPG